LFIILFFLFLVSFDQTSLVITCIIKIINDVYYFCGAPKLFEFMVVSTQ